MILLNLNNHWNSIAMNEHIKSLLQKGASFHMTNQFQKAHDCYTQVIQADPTSYHAHHLLGLLLLQNGFMEQSESHFEKCLQIKPNYTEASRNRSIFKQSSDSKVQVEFEHVEKNETYQPFQESTVGGWRHLKMVDFVGCFANNTDTWLTLGDAHGHDAYMLKKNGVVDVTNT